MKLKFEQREDVAEQIASFWWSGNQTVTFKAGQYMKWLLPHAGSDDRGTMRFFTISASPTEGKLAFTTKFNPEHPSTFKAAVQQLEPGDEIEAIGPQGEFVLPDDITQPVVLVAGGIGVTPYRSMIKSLLDGQVRRSVELIYAARAESELAFRPLFEAYGKLNPDFTVKFVVDQPGEGWTGETGQLSDERIAGLVGGQWQEKLIYLSGPEPMVEALEKGLIEAGAAKNNLRTDFFPGYIQI